MYIHEEKKLAYIAHPRTASQTTSKTLVDKLGFKLHASHHQYYDPLDPAWLIFATVRNPFDLLVSWWYLEVHKTKQEETFPHYIHRRVNDPNYYMRKGLFFGQYLCKEILHFENLQEEFNQLMLKVGLPPTEIPRRNVSDARKGRDFASYYTPELIDLVVEKFGDDIRNNGYVIPICQRFEQTSIY